MSLGLDLKGYCSLVGIKSYWKINDLNSLHKTYLLKKVKERNLAIFMAAFVRAV
jgi:hypothetical protein